MANVEAVKQMPYPMDYFSRQHIFGFTMRVVGYLHTLIVSYPIVSFFHNLPHKLLHCEVYMIIRNIKVRGEFLHCDAGAFRRLISDFQNETHIFTQ
ncbi:hypothetical protein JJP67_05615 [Enterobacter cloacae]|nr:hypothetical protein [Enterobacter cloacae]